HDEALRSIRLGTAVCERSCLPSNSAVKRAKADPDGITTARLAGIAIRRASKDPLDVDAAVAELREIAGGRGDLLAKRAGLALGFGPGVGGAVGADMWPPRALEAALL